MEMNQLVMKVYLGMQKVYEKIYLKKIFPKKNILEQYDETGQPSTYPAFASGDGDEVNNKFYLKNQIKNLNFILVIRNR